MSDGIARLIGETVRKIEVLKGTEAKFAEAMRKQDADIRTLKRPRQQ